MIAGLILTGGKNSRMDGSIKLFLTYHGKPFYEYLREALCDLPEVWLSVDSKEKFAAVGLPMVEDELPGIGPMGGLRSAMRRIDAEALFVCASDMPFLSRNTVRQLLHAWEQCGILTVARTGDRIHPLLGIYPRELLPLIEGQTASGRYRMMALIEQAECRFVDLDLPDSVRNINTVAEYRGLEQQ